MMESDSPIGPPPPQSEWGHHHSAQYGTAEIHHQDMNNVVQIIDAGEMSCLGEDAQRNSLVSLHNNSGPKVNLNGMDEIKDPLSALANAAAELDRNTVLGPHQVENMMVERKYIENKQDTTILHTYNFESKILSSTPAAIAPFLDVNEPDCTFYNEIYQYLYSGAFPTGRSEVYKKVIKKRGSNYFINEKGSLSYDFKNPKEVITSSEEQNKIFEAYHVDQNTGVHYGVRKLYNIILSKCYWRSLYVDIGNFVRNCKTCTDSSFSSIEITDSTVENNYSTITKDKIIKVWKKVLVQVLGPYNKTVNNDNEYLIVIVDPASKFILAKPSPTDGVEVNCANFVFDSFCTFGFAQCQVIGMTVQSFETVHSKYQNKFENVQDILRMLVPFDSEDAQKSFMLTLEHYANQCDWANEMLDELCMSNPDSWDEEISRFLFLFSTTKRTELKLESSPFDIMFARGPTGYVSEDEKDSVITRNKTKNPQGNVFNRRRLKSSTLQCRHCHDTFTSKISFRIHQREHTEEARKRGTADGEEPLSSFHQSSPKRKKKDDLPLSSSCKNTCFKKRNENADSNALPTEVRHQLTQSTVEAVKNYMEMTKDDRSRRGKYYKYTPELRDEIAQYALDHSVPAATLFWSEKLKSTVSESSIRNFIKAYKYFSAEIKAEIGKFAFHNGIERASMKYTQKLGFEVRKGTVIKFKKIYMKNIYGNNENGELHIPSKARSNGTNSCKRHKRTFSLETKDEIGRYASVHGISAAMDYFTEKLKFSVKESTVRKFKRLFMERNSDFNVMAEDNLHNHEVLLTEEQQQNLPCQSNIDVLQPLSVHQVQQVNANNSNNFVYQSPYSINMASGSQTNATVIPMNANALTFHHQGILNQGVTSLSYQQPVLMNQSFAAQHQAFQQSYVNNFAGSSQSTEGTPLSTLTHNAPIHLAMGGHHLNMASHLSPHLTQDSHQQELHQTHQIITSSYGNLTFESHLNDQSAPQVIMSDNNQDASVMESLDETDSSTADITSVQIHHQQSLINPEEAMAAASGVQQLSNLTINETQEHHSSLENSDCQQAVPSLSQKCHELSDEILEESEENADDLPEKSPQKNKPKKLLKGKKNKNIRSTYTCGKRGNYVSYSPELRAQIGKYASTKGNLITISHFKQTMNIDIPESTVRGLKEKYLSKKMRGEKNVKSLGFAQRGRPMRIGKYDSVVQECIKELLKCGEKISSFLVIATAKHVLMQYEPSLLEENGGPLKLNQSWAKSFLKRIGLSHLA